MNMEQLQGKWKQVKGSAREKWGKLTDDDLDMIAGQGQMLIGKLQERYGIAKEEAERQLNEWLRTVDMKPRRQPARRETEPPLPRTGTEG